MCGGEAEEGKQSERQQRPDRLGQDLDVCSEENEKPLQHFEQRNEILRSAFLTALNLTERTHH